MEDVREVVHISSQRAKIAVARNQYTDQSQLLDARSPRDVLILHYPKEPIYNGGAVATEHFLNR